MELISSIQVYWCSLFLKNLRLGNEMRVSGILFETCVAISNTGLGAIHIDSA